MVTVPWDSFGASVRGRGHVRMFTPNQDSFRIINRSWGDVAVVSDGVGSCPTSEYGSAAACRAVVCAAEKWVRNNGEVDTLLADIHTKWLAGIMPFSPEKSAATCLFVIRPNEKRIMLLGMIGDGMVAVLKKDGSFIALSEDKDDCFSNQTCSLANNTQISQWRTQLLDQDECIAAVLCTDGVADDLPPSKRKGFVKQLYKHGRAHSAIGKKRGLRKMLENWPVPMHVDDMTLVCLCNYQIRRQYE